MRVGHQRIGARGHQQGFDQRDRDLEDEEVARVLRHEGDQKQPAEVAQGGDQHVRAVQPAMQFQPLQAALVQRRV